MSKKIVLITGASSGIGQACAHVYAKQGWRLILAARRLDKLEHLAKTLHQAHGTDIHILALDVRDREAVRSSLTNLPPEWQQVHTLINNAGLAAGKAAFQDSNIDDFESMIDTNIKGLTYVSHAILPIMIKNGEGDIINIGSIAGHEVYPMGHVYCSTKHAVHAITQGMRQDTLGKGIRICSVDPGAVHTEFSEVRLKGDKEKAKAVYAGMTPLSATDIAETIFFCSSRPRHVCLADIIILPTDQASTHHYHRKTAE